MGKIRTWCGALAVVMIVATTAGQADAGNHDRYLWQGVAIGVGAAILTGAIVQATTGYGSYGSACVTYGRPVCAPPPRVRIVQPVVVYQPPARVVGPGAYCKPGRGHHRGYGKPWHGHNPGHRW